MIKNFTQEGIKNTEGLLKSILETTSNGIMAFEAVRNNQGEIIDFKWLFINGVAEKIIELKADQLLNKSLLQQLPELKTSGIFDQYKQVVETGEMVRFQQSIGTAPDDSFFKISAVKMGDGLTVNFQDISDLKEALLGIKGMERKYQKLFDESIDSIFVISDQFQFLDANESLRSLFGYTMEQLYNFTIDTLFSHPEEFQSFKNELLKSGKTEYTDIILKDQNGRKKNCIVNSARIIDDETNEYIYIGVIRDMTKRKQADRELLRAEKLSVTGKIARTIAHEVRNPLTNLTLALEQLKDEVPEEIEDGELYFSIISRNADRISQLITDLLNSSKPKEIATTPQSLNQVVQEAVYLVEDRLKLKNMKLQVNYEKSLPQLNLDADQLKIALLNLLINAIEAMNADIGILTIETYLDEDRVNLSIADNGKGLPKEDLNKLFEPFFTGKSEGTGLGLTTVQNIINSHQANIDAESEVGQGTTFKISFKVA